MASSPRFQQLCKQLPMSRTKPLSPSDAVQSLDSLIGSKHILTEYAWLVNHETFRPLHSNHVTMIHNNTRGTPVVFVTQHDGTDISTLSFGTVTPVKVGVMFRVDFYCHKLLREQQAGTLLLHTHMTQHIILFNQWRGFAEQTYLQVFMPKEMNTQSVFEYLAKVGARDYKMSDINIRAHSVERKLDGAITSAL